MNSRAVYTLVYFAVVDSLDILLTWSILREEI